MYLNRLVLKNFKGFHGKSKEIIFKGPDGNNLGSGLNILVGENNGGKSTILQAIEFLCTGVQNGDVKCKYGNTGESCGVIGEFDGEDLTNVISDFANSKHVDALLESLTSSQTLRVRRVLNDAKKVYTLYDGEGFEAEGKNNTGIDTTIKGCFDLNIVGAEDDPLKLAGYGTNSLVKNLLEDIFKGAASEDDYKKFIEAFEHFFNSPSSSLRKKMLDVETSLSRSLSTFFGIGTVTFNIPNPDVSNIVKNLDLDVDAGTKLPLAQHGNGLQRMVAFSLLVVWAKVQAVKGKKTNKPYAFILDEPEICMHPRAQQLLLKALLEISKDHQVFLTTHSPVFLHSSSIKNTNLILVQKIKTVSTAETILDFANLFPMSPTWGEISWFAYKMPTTEFHDELWAEINRKICAYYPEYKKNKDFLSEQGMDSWLSTEASSILGSDVPKEYWKPENKKVQDAEEHSIYYCVRNAIHHPENKVTQPSPLEIIDKHLERSVIDLVVILKYLNSMQNK